MTEIEYKNVSEKSSSEKSASGAVSFVSLPTISNTEAIRNSGENYTHVSSSKSSSSECIYSEMDERDHQLLERLPPLGERILKRLTIWGKPLINLNNFHAGYEDFLRSVEQDLQINAEKITTKYLFLYINKFKKMINMKRNNLYVVKQYEIFLKNDTFSVIDTDKNIVAYCETVLKKEMNINSDNVNNKEINNNNTDEKRNKNIVSDNPHEIDRDYLLTLYEVILKRFPHSFKLWYHYLKDSIETIEDIYYDNMEIYHRINDVFEISRTYLCHFRAINIMLIHFFYIQRYLRGIRKVFNKAIRCTPIGQHDDLWNLILRIATKIPNKLINYNYVRRCLIVYPEKLIELFYCHMRHRLYAEALHLFLKIAQEEKEDEEEFDLGDKTVQDIYDFFFDTVNAKKSLGHEFSTEMLKNIDVLKKYGSITSIINLVVRDRIYNGYWYEIMDAFNVGMHKCSNVKDFTMLFDSYIETLKTLIDLKTEQKENWKIKIEKGELSDISELESESESKSEDVSESETEDVCDEYNEIKELSKYRKKYLHDTLIHFEKLEKRDKQGDMFIMDTDEETEEEDNWNKYEKRENEQLERDRKIRDRVEFKNIDIVIQSYMNKIEYLLDRRKNFLADIKLKDNKNNIYLWLNKIEATDLDDIEKIQLYNKCLYYFQRHDYVGKLSDVYISYALHYYNKNKFDKATKIFTRAIRSNCMKTLDELASIFCIWIEMNLLQNRYDEALEIARLSVETNRILWNEKLLYINANDEKREDGANKNTDFPNDNDITENSDGEFFRGMEIAEIVDEYSDDSDNWVENLQERLRKQEEKKEKKKENIIKYKENTEQKLRQQNYNTNSYKENIFYPHFNLVKSVKLVCLVLDMEMNYGTIESAIDMFDHFYQAKGITVKMVLTFADFLYQRKYFNESFKTYEKGIALFRYPYVYHIYIHYIKKYIERFKDKNITYVRELFKQAIYGVDNKAFVPKQFAKYIFLMYANFEENYGLIKKALNIYKEAIPHLEEDDKVKFYKILISKASKTYGVHKCRELFEEAIGVLKDEGAREICLLYIDMEYKLNEYERARALYIYLAQFTDPMKHPSFYQEWREFEALHGDENSFKDMLRIKKSVQRIFSKNNGSVKTADKKGNVIEGGIEGAKKMLKDIIENEKQNKEKNA